MREYACIMLDYNMPEFIKKIQKEIPEEELYFGEEGEKPSDYGIESDAHITILYGLNLDVKFDDIKEHLFPIKDYKTILVNVSSFNNEKFDVLKAEVKCPKATESNKSIKENFDTHDTFKAYNPHMTIAYLKKGFAKKYEKKMLDKIETLTPTNFNYSYIDGKGNNKNEIAKDI